MGFEPTTSAVTGRHSNQLNYRAINRLTTIGFGGSNRARTCDPLLVRQMLSQLSYTSIMVTLPRFVTQSLLGFQMFTFEIFETNLGEPKELSTVTVVSPFDEEVLL